ncbi:MAG: FHA domain-containing protein [Myxococcales bacterium]|nr:FHA domain-containing protein [Myxococcales bacterium]
MGAKLLYRDAQGLEQAVNLPPEGSFLGRAIDCLVRTDDAMVSRKNCKLSFVGGRWFVEDLGSANGTYLNERRIQKEALTHGDIIRCGSLQVRFVEVADAAAPSAGSMRLQPSQPPQQPSSASVAKTGSLPVGRVDPNASAPPPLYPQRSTQSAAVIEVPGGQVAAEWRRREEEIQRLTAERDDLKKQLEESVQKLEALEQEVKKERIEKVNIKTALDKLHRQHKQTEDELQAQQNVNEQLRQEVRQLKEKVAQATSQADDLRTQLEAKDRQIAAMGDDVRRAKQAADSLNLKLLEVTKERDAQLRAVNEQRGDVEHLREILKERERMLEEQRVGLINQESQLKEMRQRTESLEKELLQARSERDNLRDRLQRSQTQVDDLRAEIDRLAAALGNQQGGGEQLVLLSRENSELRERLQEAQAEIDRLHELTQKASEEIANAEKMKAHIAQLTEQLQVARQKAQEKAEQAAREAVAQATERLKARFEEERAQLVAERDAALRAHNQAQLLQAAPQGISSAELEALRGERERLATRLKEAEARIRELEQQSAAAGSSDDGLRQAMAEFKAVAASAYDGINDALSELRLSIVLAQNTFERLERSLADRNAAEAMRSAMEQTLERAEEAKGHIRSLRSLID